MCFKSFLLSSDAHMTNSFPSERSPPARLVLREEGLYKSDREPVPYNLTVQPATRKASEQIAAETHDGIRAANARAEKELEKIRAELDYLRRRCQNEGDAEGRRLALLMQSAKEEEDHRKIMEQEASRRRTSLLLEQVPCLLAY
jgi:hypothetical protein